MTFGQIIASNRKKARLSLKDLAARIRKENGSPISPQYLNDLERDRRNPPSEHLLNQFAQELGISSDYLSFVAGHLPDALKGDNYPQERVQAAFQAFRKTLKGEDRQ